MIAFPAGAPNFQLPSPYRGVVYCDDGQIVCVVDGVRRLIFPIPLPLPPAAAKPINQSDEE